MELVSESNVPQRSTSLRHNRTKSDLGTKGEKSYHKSSVSNGIKAVNSVTGAIHNFIKWSSSPLNRDQKARSFDSLNRSSSHESMNLMKNSGSTKMEARRSSGIIQTITSQSKESSPDVSVERRDSRTVSSSDGKGASISFTKKDRESSPGVKFKFGDDDDTSQSGIVTPQKTPSRKSTDSSGGDGASLDLQEKSFEMSLNNVLNKYSETSLDKASDGREDKKSDRKKKSQPWYTMLSPTYKSKSEDFKKQFKDIPTDERLIVDYSCALQKEILVHGRMFVTQNWICFYANIFRWETVVTIPLKEVLAITKEKTARVIPNAIQVSTEREKYFFTSLTARDKTFMMLFRLWQNALMEQPMSPQEQWHWVHSCYGDDLGLTSSDDDYVPPPSLNDSKDTSLKNDSLISKGDSVPDLETGEGEDSTHAEISLDESHSAARGSGQGQDPQEQTDFSDTTEDDVSEGEIVCSEHGHLTKLAHNEVYTMSVDKLFELLFTDCEFFRNFINARKYTDVTLSPWRDEADENIGRVREASYTIPLNAPFGPKTSNTIEKHLCYKQSQPGVLYVIDAECQPMGIPYSDAFCVVNRYCLTRVSRDKCRLRVTSEVKYRKSVWGMVKNMIERNSIQGVLDYFQCLGIHLRRESEKHQKPSSMPSTSKRKLRKRRLHGIRSPGSTVEHVAPSRQLSRSQAEKMANPPTAARSSASLQREEKLIRLNADTLVRIVCFILVLLVMFNALLFYKMWALENLANVLYFPNSPETIHSFTKHPPKTHEEWVTLLNRQQQLHSAEMNKWSDLLGASISMVDQMKDTLVKLKTHVEHSQAFNDGASSSYENSCSTDSKKCDQNKPPT